MAFSTQKEFFHVPFMNESVDFECRRACVQLKGYDSTVDDRAWALDETNRSRFLTDLVTCKTPVSGFEDSDDVSDPVSQKRSERGRRVPSDSRGLNPTDSLIAATNVTLDKVQGLLQDKRNLQQKLNRSEENLKTTKAEYEKIRDILNRKFDRSDFKDYYNKIQKMAASGVFTKNDENELLQFFRKMEDLGKAYEVSQAENSYLKRLLEKLSRRAEMEKLPVQPETSTDIPYLQDQVNKLRKELMTLRKLEDNKMNITDSVSDINVDANNLNMIIKERNALRDRLRTMQDIERQVSELRKRLCDANEVSNHLSNTLDNKSKYISGLENDMRDMQSHYEQREEDRASRLGCYERDNEQLRKELCSAKLEAQKVPCLKACIARLEEAIKQKDRKLCDYDSQFKQLMCVINELRGCGCTYSGSGFQHGKQDCQTQTICSKESVDELAYYTRSTLDHIRQELRKRGIQSKDFGISKIDDCCREVERLRKIICQLQSDKSRLSVSLMDRNKCLDCLTSRLDKLCGECVKTAKDSDCMRKKLNDALNLAGNITDMQEQNQDLISVADRLSKKEIDDLINDLQNRLKNCLEEKDDFKLILQRKGFDPQQELSLLEGSRQRGSVPPRQPVDMGPLLNKLEAEKQTKPSKDLLIDPSTGKPLPGAPGIPVIDSKTGQPIPGAFIDPSTGQPITGAPGTPIIDPTTGQPIPGTVTPGASVIDPVTGKLIAVPSTGAPGAPAIDPSTGKPIPGTAAPGAPVIDPSTGKPIPGAVAPGAPVIDPSTGKPIPGTVAPGAPVIDPSTGKPVPGAVAPGAPGIDPGTGKPLPGAVAPGAPVIDPSTGKPIPGTVAPGAPVIDPSTGKPVPGAVAPGAPVIDPSTEKPIPGEVAPGAPVIDPSTGKPIPGATAPGAPAIDPATGKPIPGTTAPGAPAIDPATGKPIPGATAPGAPAIDPATGKPIPGTTAPGAPAIDPATGKPIPGTTAPGAPAIDPTTGKPIPGTGAGAPGAPSVDPATGKPIPGTTAPGAPAIDPATGKPTPGTATPGAPAIDPATGKPTPGTTAPGAPAIDPTTGKPTPGAVAPGASAIDPTTGKPTPGAVAPGAPGIDPSTGKPIPGAVAPGAPVIDPSTGKPIPGATAPGTTVDPKTGKPIPGTGGGAPGAPVIDPSTGKPIPGAVAPGAPVIDPSTGKPIPGTGAPGAPVIDPSTGKPVPGAVAPGAPGIDPATGKPLPGAVAPGAPVIDPSTGKPIPGTMAGAPGTPIVDPATGKPIPGAVAPGMPVIDPKTGKPILGTVAGAPSKIDPRTGKPIPGAATGAPIDPRAGKPIGDSDAALTDPRMRKQVPGTFHGAAGAPLIDPQTGESSDQYGNFIARSVDNLHTNLKAGNTLYNELRKILDAFVEECRFCLCQAKVPKSKFYAIIHKVLHEGIMNLSCKDMVYIHKKIFYASEKLYPGSLLNVILTEYVDVSQMQKKCCQCNSNLCCDSSQEALKDKVRKLEVEVEIARDYLNSIRSRSFPVDYELDDKAATYRQEKPRSSPKLTNRQLKSIKACITKCSQNIK